MESLPAKDLRPIFYKLTAKDAVQLFLEVDGQRPMIRPWGVWGGYLKHIAETEKWHHIFQILNPAVTLKILIWLNQKYINTIWIS